MRHCLVLGTLKRIYKNEVVNIAKKEKSLVEITEQEFLEALFNATESMEKQIYSIKDKQKDFFKLYRNYTYDKPHYNLKFLLEDNSILRYERTPKPIIGYKRKSQ
jgi:hypothetical protein